MPTLKMNKKIAESRKFDQNLKKCKKLQKKLQVQKNREF